jgi:hypothetical protein
VSDFDHTLFKADFEGIRKTPGVQVGYQPVRPLVPTTTTLVDFGWYFDGSSKLEVGNA